MAGRQASEGVFSLLDTDLYKLTMQCAILKFFPEVQVEYAFTNRTAEMKLNQKAFTWLQESVSKLSDITLSQDELKFLQQNCPFLSRDYLDYLQSFRMKPSEHITLSFSPVEGSDLGDLSIDIAGTWLSTILYEVPLLALTSEAYFRHVDTDWTMAEQESNAYAKGEELFRAGCLVSEFGSRRRRSFATQDIVVAGLKRASEDLGNTPGKLTGTSNVYFAMKHGIPPVGTVAHEWYMGIAALTNKYEQANELGLSYWLACFGEGVLGIALTDTFGTPAFFKAFSQPIPTTSTPSVAASTDQSRSTGPSRSYAEVFNGIRQDSGDPKTYIAIAREFYDSVGIHSGKSIVFSDALNTRKCIEYKAIAEANSFLPSFGVGTFFTNDFKNSQGVKSAPLNIVIKLSSADGRPAIKISDNVGKNTGDEETVRDVKRRLGYHEEGWREGDERYRWDGR